MIKNSSDIANIYGDWPSFHDAEIISLILKRCTASKTANATLELNYYEVTTENEGTAEFEVVKTKNSIIKFLFDGLIESSIEDFNHQNVIDEMTFSEAEGVTHVEIIGTFGAEIQISCKSVEVLSVHEV